MTNNTKLQSIVLSSPLLTLEYPSDIIMFHTFSTIQSNTPIWTPGSGKSIFLTALEASAPAALIVTLNRASNAPFMSIVLTATLATYGESFPSAIRFEPDEAISLTTSAAGTINITLFGYEI